LKSRISKVTNENAFRNINFEFHCPIHFEVSLVERNFAPKRAQKMYILCIGSSILLGRLEQSFVWKELGHFLSTTHVLEIRAELGRIMYRLGVNICNKRYYAFKNYVCVQELPLRPLYCKILYYCTVVVYTYITV
jgi:hypothetical protein